MDDSKNQDKKIIKIHRGTEKNIKYPKGSSIINDYPSVTTNIPDVDKNKSKEYISSDISLSREEKIKIIIGFTRVIVTVVVIFTLLYTFIKLINF